MEQITYDKLIIAIGVIMILIGAYNTIMSAVKTHREEVKRKQAPTHSLEEIVKKHESNLAADKVRIERLEADMKDVRDGQKYMVRGIQALLEHELHNGNADQMEEASQDLSRWLTNKI